MRQYAMSVNEWVIEISPRHPPDLSLPAEEYDEVDHGVMSVAD